MEQLHFFVYLVQQLEFFLDRSPDNETQPQIDRLDSGEQWWPEGQAETVAQALDVNTQNGVENKSPPIKRLYERLWVNYCIIHLFLPVERLLLTQRGCHMVIQFQMTLFCQN